MPGERKVHYSTELPEVNLVMRLNRVDTEFFQSRIQEAVKNGTGVNFILHNIRGRVSHIETDEQGDQLCIATFSDAMSYLVKSQMRGYNGPWSHCELYMDRETGVRMFREHVTEDASRRSKPK